MQNTYVILSFVASPAAQYFTTLSHKQYDIRYKKVTEHKMCVSIFFLQLLPENFLILKRIQGDITVNVHNCSCKARVILARF
jgi:hypothetical protein